MKDSRRVTRWSRGNTTVLHRLRWLALPCLLWLLCCPTVASAADPVLVAAGDIACPPGSSADSGDCQQQATSNLVLAANASAVALLGDNQYNSGTLAEYTGIGSFNDTWGRAKTSIN